MLVPFGAIPDHLLKPLHVDTALQYNLKKLKLPKATDPAYSEATLLLAPLQDLTLSEPTTLANGSFYVQPSELLNFKPEEEISTETNAELDVHNDSTTRSTPHKNDGTVSDWLKPYNMFPVSLAQTQWSTFTDDEDEFMTDCRPDCQYKIPVNMEKSKNSKGVSLSVQDVYLGAPLQFSSTTDVRTNASCNENQQSSVTDVPDTSISLLPMKEEDIDWLFTKPITSGHSVHESSKDDVITYANLTNMGYIWQTDYSFDNKLQECPSNWHNQTRV